MIAVYKIKDLETGKFSTGGLEPRWTTRGKTWSAINHVKAHLRQFVSDSEYRKHYVNLIPYNWIVVEISCNGIIETQARSFYPESKYEL